MRKVYQYRFTNDGNTYPVLNNDEYAARMITGNLFSDKMPIYQLGIQSLPGVKFYLNTRGAKDSITIGSTGIYELDLQEKATITYLAFDESSVKMIKDNWEHEGDAYIIVDIIYGEED